MSNVASVTALDTTGNYKAGATVILIIGFDDPVVVNTAGGAPTLSLSSGGVAAYVSGSGTSTLTFSYTVSAGETSADLDYASTSALALNGAAITDATTLMSANLTLPSPGTAGSLGANANIVIDTTAPATTIASLALSADTGSSNSDFITNTAGQTISGTLAANLAAGEEVKVSLDNGASWTIATSAVGSSTWSVSGVTLVGSGTLQVRVTDIAGNEGAALAQAYVLDTTAPTTTVASLAFSADTGISHSDFITNSAAQTISGTLSAGLAAGDLVRGSLDDGATWTDITSKVSGSTLTWDGVTLAGSGILRIQVVDAAGNASAAAVTGYVLDTSVAAPSIPDLTATSDTGASSTDNITGDTTPTFTGTSEANAAVSLFDTDGITVLGTTTADGTGNWSITSSTLAPGQHTVSAAITDLAGNTSTGGPGLQVTIQAQPPEPAPPPSVVTIVTPSGSLITGDGGPNRIEWSGSGADTIAGGGGNDILLAGPNNDVLQGNTGADSISAGLGEDVVRGGQGNDFLNGNQGEDLVFGDLGDDTVAGGKDGDFVHGNGGDDVLLGDLGDDTVLGGQGADLLLGGDGADYLSGDKGDDALIGGAGADLFNFVDGTGRDVIADFSHADGDQIRVAVTQAADFQALSAKMAMVGADTIITLDDLTIVLAGVPMNSLVAGDFLFS